MMFVNLRIQNIENVGNCQCQALWEFVVLDFETFGFLQVRNIEKLEIWKLGIRQFENMKLKI